MAESARSIMLIEDGPEDSESLIRALRKNGIANPIYRFSHGEAAMDFMRGRGRYFRPGETTRPSIILLDLNLPGADGRVVLSQIKSDPALRGIPVIVLTNSTSDADIEACYHAGANSFIRKPMDADAFVEVICRLKQYWFETVMLPEPATPSIRA